MCVEFAVCMFFPSLRKSSPKLQTHTVSSVRLIGDFKLHISVNVSVNDCLSLYVGPSTDWQAVRGVGPSSCPRAAEISFSPFATLNWISGRGWTDGIVY